MAINNPPKYRYPLYDEWDKDAFEYLRQTAQTKIWPILVGSTEEKNNFLITLIRTQKSLHDWRAIFVDMLNQIKEDNTINTRDLIIKYPSESISKDQPEWVTYAEDKIVSGFIDELETRKFKFEGNDNEIAEFIIRFWLSQLGLDWEYVIFMIWEFLGDEEVIDLAVLNNEMKNFDYLKLFD